MAWVLDHDVEQKAVELGFGQRVGALLLDRVLGGENKERLVEFVVLASGRDALLLHRFEQRGLRLGWRPVDLIGEQQVGENGALLELEPTLVRFGILL